MIERLDLADPATAREVLAVQHAAYRVEAELIGFDGIPPLHESLDELVRSPLEFVGVRRGGRVVAAMGYSVDGRTCEIDRLVVDPEWHRRGLGRRLVEHVLHHQVVGVSTGTANTPARRLYESLGFRPIGVTGIGPGVTATSFQHWHDCFATSFDDDVANYEAARPPYPDALFDLLATRCGIGPAAKVLEIGAGPGTATVRLLDLGATVSAVEPGERMSARLRERVAGRACEVITGRFEDVRLTGGYDAVCAATSFHWTDPVVSVAKVADQLRPGGWAALWWNVHAPPDGSHDRLSTAIQPITARFQTAERRAATPYALAEAARRSDLGRDPRLEYVDHIRLAWPFTHDSASLRALFASFSDWATLPEPDRSRALDDVAAIVDDRFGGTVTRTYTTAVHLLRRH